MQQFIQATDHSFYSELGPNWHLASLAVSPKHHRRGIGKQLMAWGLDIATREMTPVTLEASEVGKALYAGLGFLIVARSHISEGLDGVAMVWEPDASKGRWLDTNGDGTASVKSR
jgi:ribosomal protein S18 acetylase RimI-like enzyme